MENSCFDAWTCKKYQAKFRAKTTGEGDRSRYVGTWFAPPSTPDFSGKLGLNLALAWLLPVAVVKLHDGELHAVGWGEGPWALVTPVKPNRVWVGL